MSSRFRALKVTIGLAAIGALLGALCAGVMGSLLILAMEGPHGFVRLNMIAFVRNVMGFGALVGAVLGPALAWGLLRHVSIGRALLWTTVGTVVGSVIGEFMVSLNPFRRFLPGIAVGALLGFFLAGVLLRLRAGRAAVTSSDRAV